MADPGVLLFGQIAVQNRFASAADVERAVAEQQRLQATGVTRSIGEIMTGLKLITPEQLTQILEVQEFVRTREEDKSLGRLAVANGFLTVAPTRRLEPGEAEANARAAAAAARPMPVARVDGEGSGLIALRTCAYCQATTDGERSRCVECGYRSCIYCGTVAVDGQVECGHCKARLTE